jgi:acetyltransferase-like isoleucine patch superfamily enzyme
MITPRITDLLLRAVSVFLWLMAFAERVHQKAWNVAFRARLHGTGTFYIHRSAQIAGVDTITVGENFYAGAGLRLEAVTGYYGMSYSPRVLIKDNVTLNDHVHIGANHYVELGNNVLVASKVYISDHGHGNYVGPAQSSPDIPPAARPLTTNRAVVIEDNVWIGESVSVLPGVRIGRGSIVGANAVVTLDIPAYSIAVGAPAHVIKKYNHVKHTWDAVDKKQQESVQ